MGLTPTFVILVCAVGAFLWARHMDSKEPDPLNPRMIPYKPVMFLAATVVLLMVVHLVNMAGIETGKGRRGMR